MSAFTFRPAKRENVSLLIGLAGGTGSGKTYSAMRLATGLAAGKKFAVIDTENGRALHYADQFQFDHGTLAAPFRPDAYADAIEAAAAAGYGVILVDSFSHEHAGEGGLLDWHEEEFQRLGGRDAVKMTAWIKPKMAHKAMVNRLLQVNAHVILCFRAEEKIEIVKVDGKTEVRPKQTLTGLDGWVPVCEKTLPFELTLSFLLTAAHPGIPKPVKLQEQHRAFFALDKPVSEETGAALAAWAAGASAGEPTAVDGAPAPPVAQEPAPTGEPASPAAEAPLSAPQRKKLDVLVAKLRAGGHITAEQLWRSQKLNPDLGMGDDGKIHWSPLRDGLSKEQASALIERLTSLEANVTGDSEFASMAADAIAAREAAS